MKAIIRERLLERLLLVPNLINLQMQRQGNFVPQTLIWLEEGEKQLEPLRSSFVSRLASFRSQLLAMEDGLISEMVHEHQRSTRKKQIAFASHVIASVEQEMRFEIERIDTGFAELKDKLAQLIAIVSSQKPLPHSMHLTADYLDGVWRLLQENEQTSSMSAYIQAQTDTVDRRYLLQGLMENFFTTSEVS